MAKRINADDIKKILIVGHSNIGDVSCDLVIINPLRRYFTQAEIFFITSPQAKDAAESYKGIKRVIVLDKHNRHKGLSGRIRFHYILKKENFDLVIAIRNTLMYRWLRLPFEWNIQRAHKKEFVKKKTHPIDIYLKFLRSKGIAADEPVFEFALDDEKQFCEDFFKRHAIAPEDKIVGIMPLAAAAFKNWPVQRWNRLAKILKSEFNIKTLAFGKASEDLYAQKVLRDISSDIISAIDKTTLKQALALIRGCDVFIGPDSSFLHLASCLRVESIGLYGPTPADYVYPYFHRHNIIITKEAPEGMLCFIDPSSCSCRKFTKPSICMEEISVEEVLEAVKSKLKKK